MFERYREETRRAENRRDGRRRREIDLISLHICFPEFAYKFVPKDLRETDIRRQKRKKSSLPSHVSIECFPVWELRTRNAELEKSSICTYIHLSMKINRIRDEKEMRNIGKEKLGVILYWAEHLKFPCKFLVRYLREKDIADEDREKRRTVRDLHCRARATAKHEEL